MTTRTRRDLLARVIPRKFEVLEYVNNNVEFVHMRQSVFPRAPRFDERFGVHRAVADAVGDGAIQYLEFGVFQGESILRWAEAFNAHPESRFVGFDTFHGLPEDWTKAEPRGTFDVAGQQPATEDPRVSFVPGLFQDTLDPFLEHAFLADRPSVVHIDCDLYSATLFVLASLDRLLPAGTHLIFDDFYSMNHEFRAFLDYLRAFQRSWTPVASTQHCTEVAIRLD